MPLHPHAALAALLIAFGLPAAHAQGRAAAVPGSSASTPSVAYRSALDGYRRFSDQPISSWRAANDLVAQVGGWQAYAREAAGDSNPSAPASGSAKPDAAASAPAAAGSAPAAQGGHQGHHKQTKP
jgi:hypothetical protein